MFIFLFGQSLSVDDNGLAIRNSWLDHDITNFKTPFHVSITDYHPGNKTVRDLVCKGWTIRLVPAQQIRK